MLLDSNWNVPYHQSGLLLDLDVLVLLSPQYSFKINEVVLWPNYYLLLISIFLISELFDIVVFDQDVACSKLDLFRCLSLILLLFFFVIIFNQRRDKAVEQWFILWLDLLIIIEHLSLWFDVNTIYLTYWEATKLLLLWNLLVLQRNICITISVHLWMIKLLLLLLWIDGKETTWCLVLRRINEVILILVCNNTLSVLVLVLWNYWYVVLRLVVLHTIHTLVVLVHYLLVVLELSLFVLQWWYITKLFTWIFKLGNRLLFCMACSMWLLNLHLCDHLLSYLLLLESILCFGFTFKIIFDKSTPQTCLSFSYLLLIIDFF